MRRWTLAIIGTTVVYMAALGSADPIDAGIGLVLSAAVLYALRHTVFNPEPSEFPPLRGRVIALLPWLLSVIWQSTIGVWHVTRASLGRHENLPRSGIVAIPIEGRTTEGVAVSALTATISPGEVLVDVDWERDVMYLHVLDASDSDGVRKMHRDLYERRQRKVIP